jgi:hypothetical protein
VFERASRAGRYRCAPLLDDTNGVFLLDEAIGRLDPDREGVPAASHLFSCSSLHCSRGPIGAESIGDMLGPPTAPFDTLSKDTRPCCRPPAVDAMPASSELEPESESESLSSESEPELEPEPESIGIGVSCPPGAPAVRRPKCGGTTSTTSSSLSC